MKWDFVVEFWLARLYADAELMAFLGGEHIYPAGPKRPVVVPSVEYVMLDDREGEWLNPIGIQVDYWARGMKKAQEIERRLRLLTHQDYGQELGGERLWMNYTDSRTIEYPNDPGVVHRALDFTIETVRLKYTH